MDLTAVAEALLAEARETNERRLLVLSGDADATYDAAEAMLDAAPLALSGTTLVGPRDALHSEHLPLHAAADLLGATRDAVVVDCHGACRPNALGRVVGAVDGGGLLVLLTPPLDDWPERRDGFDERLAVPPFDVAEVTGHFRRRLVRTLRAHRGIAIVDVDAGTVADDGLTNPAPRLVRGDEAEPPAVPPEASFPRVAYERCLTDDQAAAVEALAALRDPGHAAVVEADRGRGKSSAAGIAAACLAAAGREVLVTAPAYRGCAEAFARARETLDDLDALAATDGDPPKRLDAAGGGCVRHADPPEAAAQAGDVDVLVVDEAAALPVSLLAETLDAPSVAYATTVHGYEGTGRGFSVRFRDRLAESDHAVTDVALATPVRYAAGDPVEVWAFDALLLDARPPAEQVVADATPGTVTYEALTPDDGLADETTLREAFGLLVLAHYRTEPDDLARLLDAPNVRVRALVHAGHVVAVALLAAEGDLPADVRAEMYEGGRVAGNMVPDVLTSQLRDEAAGEAGSLRVLRIATHHAVRSRGLGSALLSAVADEFADHDYLSVGFGATPELCAFWRENGYRTVHLSTTRNERSGEYSAVMLAPLSGAGRALHDRHARWFVRRAPAVLSDALDDADPDLVRAALAAAVADAPLPRSERDWRVVADAAYGPGLFDVDPGPFRLLAVRHLVDGRADLDARAERLLVLRALQARDWPTVADRLDYPSTRQCMRALGEAYRVLLETYGSDVEVVAESRERFD